MSEQEYVEHQYMCSECQQLFNTLEEVLVHQQIHTGAEGDEVEVLPSLEDCDAGKSQYQCLECGAILRNPDELLLHQELHMREAGQELCEVTEVDAVDAEVPIQYQCLECLALFDTPELWLAHRQAHNRSSTHSSLNTDTEYVLQADGSVTPVQLLNVQNLVLDEQKAGQILTLAQALREQDNPSKTAAPPRTMLVPANTSLPGSTSAMLRLQFCSAQAIADGSASATLRKAKLLSPLLPAGPIRLDNVTTLNLLPSSGQVNTLNKENEEILLIHPYECSECNLLFSTPEDFLQHQGEHFLGQDKESGDTGVMVGYEDISGAKEDEGRSDGSEEGSKVIAGRRTYTARSAGLGLTPSPSNLRCEECKRKFTSANRLVAHLRVHEQGTHECPECDKVFKKLVSLQTHMRTHSGEARFLCVDCGHGFTTEITLMIHRKSHTSEPLHKCPFCAKTFTNMTKFLYHRRTHRVCEPTAPVSQFVLAQQSPLSIIQRAREREAAWRKERQAVTIPPMEDDRKESSGTGSGGTAVVSQSSEPTENGLHAEPSNTEQTQNGGKIQTDDPNHSTAANVGGGGEEESKLGTLAAEEEPKFPCSICKKRFSSQVHLLRHRRTTHTTERRFKCNICGKPFKKQIHLRNHLRTHTGERPFQCSVCGKTFSSLANLSRHGLTHTGVRPYRCDICHKAFSQSSNLRQHRQHLHSNTTPSPCPDCSATFIRPAKFVAHRFLHHPGSPAPYPCPHCSEGFLRKRQRDLHCLEEHPNLTQPHGISQDSQVSSQLGATDNTEQLSTPSMARPNLDCTICGKRLNSPANLRLHQLSHGLGPGRPRGSSSATGKSHPCPVCGKLFGSASSVTLHQRVHTGERPYPCTICGKRFRQNTHLREHLCTHSGERPFRCEFCDKGFVQSMHLAEHRRTHTGERPHACGECGKTFKTVSNLRNHRKTHTRTQKQQEPEHNAEAVTAECNTATFAVVEASEMDLATTVPAFCQQELQLGQPQVIQIQTSNLTQTHGTPTIMCNELGETIAIIETSGDLAEAIELYHKALESGISMEVLTVDSLQLM
ncbi:zinc finger protein 574-like isoform X1 [Sinocyclocheilus anshuiensis]|uniref:Zinc finger protein 574-like n=1 Tax=Sinocyclocheilus anshuiensis TaxID=1608454 RepID=A0A671NK14_9TELE|nr:PREDICTED: zinc finger protein 574-like isoform X1 [Sinocyclocheilus anshuiensis]XP_016319589.1 PREDICTED: zinc finger protein 574-like isoform X1 [Sinocyclocheilus anshuiensis]